MGYIKQDYFKQGYISDVFLAKIFMNVKDFSVEEQKEEINFNNANYCDADYCNLYILGIMKIDNVNNVKKVVVTGENFINKIANYLKDKDDGCLFEFLVVEAKTTFIGNNTGFIPTSILIQANNTIQKEVVSNYKFILRTDKNEYEITPKIENGEIVFDIPDDLKGEEFYIYKIEE